MNKGKRVYVRHRVWDRIDDCVEDRVLDCVSDHIHDCVWDHVYDRVWDQVEKFEKVEAMK